MQSLRENWLNYLLFIILAAIIAVNFYYFYFSKINEITIEVECNPTEQTCFSRDCSEEDSCPPNNLSEYRIFTLSAKDFANCEYGSCLQSCTRGAIECNETICGESEEDACVYTPDETITDQPSINVIELNNNPDE